METELGGVPAPTSPTHSGETCWRLFNWSNTKWPPARLAGLALIRDLFQGYTRKGRVTFGRTLRRNARTRPVLFYSTEFCRSPLRLVAWFTSERRAKYSRLQGVSPRSASDLIVVGGGPVGLATSIFAAGQGMRVTLLERGVLPMDKPCGEGIMPEGVRLMEAMGISVTRSYPFHGIRYIDESVGAVEARFASGNGLGMRRLALSSAMVARAKHLGVRLQERTMVRDVRIEHAGVSVDLGGERLRAPFLAAADGLHSRIRGDAGLDVTSRWSRFQRYGFRRHYRIRPWSRFVEIHWARGAEAYVTPVGEDEVGVALLWHERAPSYQAMLARFPTLDARLRGAPVTTSLKGAGPFRRGARRVQKGRLALVGDAAGYVDAITGEGVALGFRSAREVVRALSSGRGLAAYEGAYRRLRRRHVILTELALLLATHPWLRSRVIGALSRRPRIFSQLVAATDYP